MQVRIAEVAVAHPPLWLTQEEAACRVGALSGDERRVRMMARASAIERRAIAAPPADLVHLTGIEARNRVYRQTAPGLALEAAAAVLPSSLRSGVGCLVSSSCTGYMLPGWGALLVRDLPLPCETARLPVTEAGCAGGVVALAAAADFLRSRPGTTALAVAAELCSLSFHAGGDSGNLTSALIFGDGAGAARLETGAGEGLEIRDALSLLIPGSEAELGFDLTDAGFYPVLSRSLAETVAPGFQQAASRLLRRNGLDHGDVAAWLLHPGGARILCGLEAAVGAGRQATRWSWDSLREQGNTSSAAIFDVLRRFLADEDRPHGPAVAAAFGPGVSVELLLLDT